MDTSVFCFFFTVFMTIVKVLHNSMPTEHCCVVKKLQLSSGQQSLSAQGSLAGTRWNSPWMPAVSVTAADAGDQPNLSEPTAVARTGRALAGSWMACGFFQNTTRRVKEFILVVLVYSAAAVTRPQTRPGFD